jgi:hypothetical protein
MILCKRSSHTQAKMLLMKTSSRSYGLVVELFANVLTFCGQWPDTDLGAASTRALAAFGVSIFFRTDNTGVG